MESPTKERLTGGLIFVAVLIIIVPEMFSGPGRQSADAPSADSAEAGPQMRTYDLVLDPQAGESASQETLAPRAAATVEPAPEPEPEPEPAPEPEVQSPAVAEVREAAPVQQAAPPVASATPRPPAPAAAAPAGRWWVQLGRFSERENAERLAIDLRRAGYTISLSQIRADGKELTLVRAGPVADRAAATALQKRLAAAGQRESFLVPP